MGKIDWRKFAKANPAGDDLPPLELDGEEDAGSESDEIGGRGGSRLSLGEWRGVALLPRCCWADQADQTLGNARRAQMPPQFIGQRGGCRAVRRHVSVSCAHPFN
eukprot:evm.model.scf_1214EXC.3 EVM.evm.TU.scf_1214EXC.3   scf_1214EXC:33402-33811(-)